MGANYNTGFIVVIILSLRMFKFKAFVILLFLSLCIFCFVAHAEDNSESKDTLNRFYISVSVSPRYCNAIIQDLYTKEELANLYGYTFLNYDLHFYYKVKNRNLIITTGVSYLTYGLKEENVPAYAGTIILGYHNYVSVYDTISVKRMAKYVGVPLGIGKFIQKGKCLLIPETGLVFNALGDYRDKPINSDNIHFLGGGGIPSSDYYLTAYLKLGFKLSMDKTAIFLAPVFNSSFYNISGSSGFVYQYQMGIDCGLIFKIK